MRLISGTNVEIRNTYDAISETAVMGNSKGGRKETVGYRQRSGVSMRGVLRGSPEDRRAVDEAKMVRDFVFFPVD